MYKAVAVGKRRRRKRGIEKQAAEMRAGCTRTFSRRVTKMNLAEHTRLLLEQEIVTGLVMNFLNSYGP